MKKILYIIIPLALVALVVFKLLSNKEISENRVFQFDPEKPIMVHTAKLKPQTDVSKHVFTGTFEPIRETKISSETQGKINSMDAEAGTRVHKGQSLIQLDNSLLQLQLQAVDVQIEGFEADVARYTILAEADAIQGVQLEKTQLGLKGAKVQRKTLQEQIAKTTITAPFDGIVTMKMTEIGAFAAPGMPLLQITDISSLKFTVNVAENDLDMFHENQLYTVLSDLYPSLELSGKTVLIGSKGNMASSFPVQFEVKNTADMKIRSGMFGKVVADNKQTNEVLMIPASAIVGAGIKPQVYTLVNGKAKLQEITIAKRTEDQVVVSDGLKLGDILILNGFINLFDGAPVVAKD